MGCTDYLFYPRWQLLSSFWRYHCLISMLFTWVILEPSRPKEEKNVVLIPTCCRRLRNPPTPIRSHQAKNQFLRSADLCCMIASPVTHRPAACSEGSFHLQASCSSSSAFLGSVQVNEHRS